MDPRLARARAALSARSTATRARARATSQFAHAPKTFRVFVQYQYDSRFGKLRGKSQRNARTRLHAGAWGLRRCDAAHTAGDTPEDSMDSTMESTFVWVYRNIWNPFPWCIEVSNCYVDSVPELRLRDPRAREHCRLHGFQNGIQFCVGLTYNIESLLNV